MPLLSPRVSSSSKSSGVNWKCPYCGAMNEDENMVCDGCGDERPAAPSLASSKHNVRVEDEEEPQTSSDSPLDDTLEADDSSDSYEKEALDESIEPPAKLDNENEDYEAPTTITTPLPPTAITTPLPLPSTSDQEEDESMPSLSLTSQRLYFVFVNTPAQSLVKSRVAIEFDVFSTVSIGRNPENVVVIPDPEVSRKHAQLTLEGGKVILRDLKSANGTFVYDGKSFQRVNDSVEIKPNSILKFGSGTIVRLLSE